VGLFARVVSVPVGEPSQVKCLRQQSEKVVVGVMLKGKTAKAGWSMSKKRYSRVESFIYKFLCCLACSVTRGEHARLGIERHACQAMRGYRDMFPVMSTRGDLKAAVGFLGRKVLEGFVAGRIMSMWQVAVLNPLLNCIRNRALLMTDSPN